MVSPVEALGRHLRADEVVDGRLELDSSEREENALNTRLEKRMKKKERTNMRSH